MGVLKNDVGRPTNKTIMIRNILKGVCFIIVVGLCFLGGYFLTNRKSDNTDVVVDNVLAKKILDDFVLGNYNKLVSENFSDSYKTIIAITNSEGTAINTCKDFFGSKLKKDKNISGEHYYIDMNSSGVAGYCYDDSYEYYLSGVENVYKKFFGNNGAPIKDNVIVESGWGEPLMFGYSSSNNSYKSLECYCDAPDAEEYVKIYKSYIKNNELHIVFTYFDYYMPVSSEQKSFGFDNTGELFEIKYDTNTGDMPSKAEIFNEHENKLHKYEIVFEKRGENYIYKSLNNMN